MRTIYIDRDTNEEYTSTELNIDNPALRYTGIKNGVQFYYEPAGNRTEGDDFVLEFVKITEQQYEELVLQEFRYERSKLLNAFDIWEKAVLRGREQDNPAIMLWYQNLLDLDEYALENVPNAIKKFI